MYIQMIVYQAIPTSEITMSFQIDEATIMGNTIEAGNMPPELSSSSSAMLASPLGPY